MFHRLKEPVGVPFSEREYPEGGLPDSPSASFARTKDPNVLDVLIPDAEPFAFEMVLDYIYTDKIDPTQRGQEPGSNGVVLLMMAVYRLALQFGMNR